MYKQALLKKTMTGAAMPNKNAMSVRFSAESKLKTESSLWQSFSSYKSLNSLCSRNNTVKTAKWSKTRRCWWVFFMTSFRFSSLGCDGGRVGGVIGTYTYVNQRHLFSLQASSDSLSLSLIMHLAVHL